MPLVAHKATTVASAAGIEKADFYASLNQLDKDDSGYFLPLSLSNSGEKEINDATIIFSTCYSDKPLSFHETKLPAGQSKIFKIREQDLIQNIASKPCDPNSIAEAKWCHFGLYTNTTNALVPVTNCTIWICGQCPYTVSIESLNINKTLNYTMFSPFPQTFQIFTTPKIESTENLTYESDQSISISRDYERCIMNKDCIYWNGTGIFNPKFPSLPMNLYIWHVLGRINVTILPIN